MCLDTIGAREVMREEFGALVPASGLRTAISRLLADDGRRKQMSSAARQFARHQRFSDRAAELANVPLVPIFSWWTSPAAHENGPVPPITARISEDPTLGTNPSLTSDEEEFRNKYNMVA